MIAYIMAYCLEEELIKYNSARDVDYSDLPYAKSTKSKGKIKKTPFTLTQTPKILAWCDEQLKKPKINPLHPLGIKLGIKMADRYGELRGLRWEDIDLDNQTITVRDQMVQTYVLNDDLTTTYQGRQAAGHIKGHEEVETLPLPSDAVAILKQIQSMNLDDEYVFPAGHFRSNTFNDKIKEAASSIGLNGKLYSSHSLRTTAATNLYQITHDIYQVQRLLHHTTVEMTMKYIKDLELNEKLRENLEYDFDEDEKLQ